MMMILLLLSCKALQPTYFLSKSRFPFLIGRYPAQIFSTFHHRSHFQVKATYLENTVDEIKNALVPEGLDDVLALFSAETIANLVGGFSSKEFAAIIQNVEKELITKVASSETVFAVEGVAVSSVRFGIHKPFITVLIFFFSSLVSHTTKYIGRKINEDEEKSKAIDLQTLCEDMIKWLAYDGLLQSFTLTDDVTSNHLMIFLFGMAASLVTSCIKRIYSDMEAKECWKISLEDGVLFMLYEIFKEVLTEVTPKLLKQ